MTEYQITFGTDLSQQKLAAIENEFEIPARFDTAYIEAKSPRQAIKLFRKEYGIKRRLIRTSDLLKYVYVVRPAGRKGYANYRVGGLEWNSDYESMRKINYGQKIIKAIKWWFRDET